MCQSSASRLQPSSRRGVQAKADCEGSWLCLAYQPCGVTSPKTRKGNNHMCPRHALTDVSSEIGATEPKGPRAPGIIPDADPRVEMRQTRLL
jgi:hypothetical protein